MKLYWQRSGPKPQDRPVWWGLGLLYQSVGNDRLTLFLPTYRILGFLTVFFLTVWLSGAWLLLTVLHRHGYASVTYLQLVQPWRWSGLRATQASDLLTQAHAFSREGDSLKALWAAKAALRKDPTRRESYALLGELCARFWLMAEATDYLQQGLARTQPDLAYMKLVLEVAAWADDPQTMLEVTTKYWQAGWGQEDPGSRLLLATRKATALVQLRRWPEAVEWCRQLRQLPKNPLSLVDVEAYALLQSGRADEARQLLSRIPVDFAVKHDSLIRLLADVHYELGDLKSANYSMKMYLDLNRGNPTSHLEALRFCADKPALQTEYRDGVREFYTRFGEKEDAMSGLAALLAEQHAIEELEQLHAFARTHGFLPGLWELAYAEELISRARLAEAGAVLGSLPPKLDDPQLNLKLTLLRQLLGMFSSDLTGATAALSAFVSSHALPLNDSFMLADLLGKQGLLEEADHVLQTALRNYPRSHRLAARMEELSARRRSLQEARTR